jgi:uncharacterized membrane protein
VIAMSNSIRPSRAVFAAVLVGFGVISIVYGNSSEIWEPIPSILPGRGLLIYMCGIIEIVTGLGLLLDRTVVKACRILLPFLLLWILFLKLPELFIAPQSMVSWASFGELAAICAGGWCLFAAHSGKWEEQHLRFAVGEHGVAIARMLLIVALPLMGLSHFVYHDVTASLVPKWMHFSIGWTYLTGAASVAAAAALLFGICPRLAANLEAAMIWLITLLVWVPRLIASPTDQGYWTEFVISCAIACGVWLVADTYRTVPWLGVGKVNEPVSLDEPHGPYQQAQPV